MLTTVEGVYRDGRIELDEAPALSGERRVRVMFLEDEPFVGGDRTAPAQQIRYGMFAGPTETTEADFRLAEFHGDSDDGLDWRGL
jgi:hypothetical protein